MIANNAADLGSLLRTARTARRMSQAELAAIIGVSRQWVISAEQGAPTAHLNLMIAALRAVDLLMDVIPDASVDEADHVLGGDRAD